MVRLTARPVGTPLSKVRVRASHGQPARRPEPVYRPLTRGPTLIDGRPQRVGVGLGSRALLGAAAVSTAGLAVSPEGPTLVGSVAPVAWCIVRFVYLYDLCHSYRVLYCVVSSWDTPTLTHMHSCGMPL